jgi:hypothetical protein
MDAKQDNNRSPEILRGEMDADRGKGGELGHSDFCSRRFLGLLTSGFIALAAAQK